ncbi:hypothetical protein [Streptomyces sp. Inha503]|uniref:hypothetical protein n=1 Tax=Streptomyces sp. Inha503 TaxID=3383314 RepID=UPI0039A37446
MTSSATPYAAPWRSSGGALSQDADRGTVTRYLPWLGQVLEYPERDEFWQEISARRESSPPSPA